MVKVKARERIASFLAEMTRYDGGSDSTIRWQRTELMGQSWWDRVDGLSNKRRFLMAMTIAHTGLHHNVCIAKLSLGLFDRQVQRENR